MSEDTDYTLEDLLEQAKNDPSWEADEKKRAELVAALAAALAR